VNIQRFFSFFDSLCTYNKRRRLALQSTVWTGCAAPIKAAQEQLLFSSSN